MPAQGYGVRSIGLNIGQSGEGNIAGLLVVKSSDFKTEHAAQLQSVRAGQQ